jgi:DmsE family decaheme c-type cytochrome
MRRVAMFLAGAGAVLLLSLPVARAVEQQAEPVARAGEEKAAAPHEAVDPAQCAACHEPQVRGMQHTGHATVPGNCTNCHAGAAAHLAAKLEGKEGPPPAFPKTDPKAANATCLQCHDKGSQANWHMTAHDRRNVTCTSCHSVHAAQSVRSLLQKKTDSETCYECHKSERAKTLRTSHHPVREGKMGCASCHNAHDGSRPKLLRADSTNELCYTCHTEKRGPFLFEHAPVREDCATCHDPHGSNHKRLLAQKLPNLCWNCHLTGSGHFGSGDNLSTEHGARVAPPGAPSGFPTANSRFIEKSCKNCHMNVHGSNSPSGAFFLR